MPDAAILKLKAWHPGTKHGGQETTKSRNLICPAGTPHRRFLGSAISRGRQPAFHMRQHTSHDQRSYFTAQPRPCCVPGCRLVPSKIAASGAKKMRPPRNDTKTAGFFVKTCRFYNRNIQICRGATPQRASPKAPFHAAASAHFTCAVSFPCPKAEFHRAALPCLKRASPRRGSCHPA